MRAVLMRNSRVKPYIQMIAEHGIPGTVDVQTVKAQEAAVAVAQHNVTAQENLVKQLRQRRAYASVVAPFDSVITQRNVDVGALVQGNATSGTFSSQDITEWESIESVIGQSSSI